MNAFLIFRYAVFTLFIIFSTIIASISAWNLGLLKDAGFYLQVDGYLIFLGVTGLLVVFPILFIEFCRKGALVSLVWFELAWVGLFWILHLSGAAAFVALAPSFVCGPQAKLSFEDICVSQNVLKTFTWLCSVTLVTYLLALIVASALHMKTLPDVWKSSIPEVAWFTVSNQPLGSSPPTPILARYRSGSSTDSGSSNEKSAVLPLYLPHSQQTRGQQPSAGHYVVRVPAPTARVEKLPAPPPVAHHPAHQPPARRQPTHYEPSAHHIHVKNTLVEAGFLPPPERPAKQSSPPRSNGLTDSRRAENNIGSSPSSRAVAASPSSSPTGTNPAAGAPRKPSPRERHRPPPLDLTLATRPLGTRVPARR